MNDELMNKYYKLVGMDEYPLDYFDQWSALAAEFDATGRVAMAAKCRAEASPRPCATASLNVGGGSAQVGARVEILSDYAVYLSGRRDWERESFVGKLATVRQRNANARYQVATDDGESAWCDAGEFEALETL
jgi:hypothetical protein